MSEGVRWSVRPSGEGTVLSATVWASFPGLKGRLMEWLFQGPLNGAARDRLHAQRELEFIRSELEKAGGGDGDIANDHLTPG